MEIVIFSRVGRANMEIALVKSGISGQMCGNDGVVNISTNIPLKII